MTIGTNLSNGSASTATDGPHGGLHALIRAADSSLTGRRGMPAPSTGAAQQSDSPYDLTAGNRLWNHKVDPSLFSQCTATAFGTKETKE